MKYSVNCSTLFTDRPLLDRPTAAKAAGFDCIELWWPFSKSVPSAGDVDAFEAALEEADVRLTALNFYAGDMPAGERGILSHPSRVKEFRDNVAVVAGIGQRLGCRYFNALYGNRVPGHTREAQEQVAVENLAFAAEAVAATGGTILLEALSGAPEYPLKVSADVQEVIGRTMAASGHSNIKLLADLYHLSQNGQDVDALIRAYASDFGHIQIADAPGRGAPGSGSLPLSRWIRDAREHGYEGIVGLEYFSGGENAFAWLRDRARSSDKSVQNPTGR